MGDPSEIVFFFVRVFFKIGDKAQKIKGIKNQEKLFSGSKF